MALNLFNLGKWMLDKFWYWVGLFLIFLGIKVRSREGAPLAARVSLRGVLRAGVHANDGVVLTRKKITIRLILIVIALIILPTGTPEDIVTTLPIIGAIGMPAFILLCIGMFGLLFAART